MSEFEHTASSGSADELAAESTEQWQSQLLGAIDDHFAGAHQRVDRAYRQHFASLRAILGRHWQHRRDVPADLLAAPRALWHTVRRSKSQQARPLTGKEQAVAAVMAEQVLDLPGLQALMLEHLRHHPDYHQREFDELRALLAPYDSAQAARRLQLAVAQWGQRHDSNRDLLLFFSLGLLGRAVSDKIAFGSASLIGMSAASSVYISQQGALSALWASWFGVPGWVAVSGALAGFAVVIAATPILSPFIEYGFNRYRTRQRLQKMVEQVHRDVRQPLSERLWQYSGYLQFIPDLIQILKQLR